MSRGRGSPLEEASIQAFAKYSSIQAK